MAREDEVSPGPWRWKFEPPPYPPRPWTVREVTVPTARGGRERVWLVADATGRTLADCYELHVAQRIANNANGMKETP